MGYTTYLRTHARAEADRLTVRLEAIDAARVSLTAALAARDRAAAAHVLRVAGPYSGRIAVSGPSPNRPFDQALAQAALATGDVLSGGRLSVGVVPPPEDE